MKLAFKNTFVGYFKYYYQIIGNKVLVSLGLSVFISFLDGMGIAMFIPLLQTAGNEGKGESNLSGNGQQVLVDVIHKLGLELNITTVLAMLVFLFVSKGALKFLQQNYQNNIKYIFITKVRFKLLDSLVHLSYKGFLKLSAGKIQNTLTGEVQRLFQSMNFYFLAAQSAVMLLTYVALAFYANYQFALLVAIGASLSNFIYRKIYVAVKQASVELSKNSVKFNGFLIQSVQHFKYLKSTNYFGKFSKKLRNVIIDTETINKRMGYYGSITLAVREPIVIIIVAVVILIQVRLMGASIGPIIFSLLLLYRSLTFLMVIQNNWQSFMQSTGSMNAVATMSEEMDNDEEKQAIEKLPSFSQSIQLKDIDFSYGEKNIISKMDLLIEKNKSIALIGESGSGKSTVANLIAGLIAPNKGGLLIDGNKLTDYNIDDYRGKIGYISQEPVIFNDDIFNNITFWAERTPETEARFWETIKLASLEDFIETQPERELTKLGDNGLLISGGQKQRISIARELFKKAEILILDEATSALDSETEKVIQNNIEQLQGSYTMIIIAHRLSTIKNVDQIYLLEKGVVAANGDFKTMLETSPKFRHMVSLQEFATT